MSNLKTWNDFIRRFALALGSEDDPVPFEGTEELETIIKDFIDGGLSKYTIFKDLLTTLIENPRYAHEFLDEEFVMLFNTFENGFPDSYGDFLLKTNIKEWSSDFKDYARGCEVTSTIIDLFWTQMSVELQGQLKNKTDNISMEGLEDKWWEDCDHNDLNVMFWTHLKFTSKILNPYYGTEKCRCDQFSCEPCYERQQQIRAEERRLRQQLE